MKKINADLNGDINGLVTSVKVIGSLGMPDTPLCVLSEKNLIKVIKKLGNVSASELATRITTRLLYLSPKDDFTVIKLQEIMTEEMEHIQFAVDCGELLIGDDSTIKEFLGEKMPRDSYEAHHD